MVGLPHIQGSSGVIISGSPRVTPGLAERSSQSLPKAWPEKERRRGGGEALKRGRRRRRRREGSPRIRRGAGNHRLNTDRMKGKGRERVGWRGGGVGGGGVVEEEEEEERREE